MYNMDGVYDVIAVGLLELVTLHANINGFQYYCLVGVAGKDDGFYVGSHFAKLT
jgi:hypothetical protein